MRSGTTELTDDASFTIRTLERQDTTALRNILEEVNVFSQEEIKVALELMEIYLDEPHQHDYHFYVAVNQENQPIGYCCIGPTPMTTGTFDLYWIVTKVNVQRQGVGEQLLALTEQWVRSQGGRLIIAETSSTEQYEKARKFYLTQQFQEAARIKDYYKRGDDLIIFVKYLSQSGATS
jgi:ribosomal protein S18 acetylase RimI-like enzyme